MVGAKRALPNLIPPEKKSDSLTKYPVKFSEGRVNHDPAFLCFQIIASNLPILSLSATDKEERGGEKVGKTLLISKN